jgi:hypothetical protein
MTNAKKKLRKTAISALRQAADDVRPHGDDGGSILGRAGRALLGGLASGLADELESHHCQALTRYSVGKSLPCGKTAPMFKDGLWYCRTCAPADAIELGEKHEFT